MSSATFRLQLLAPDDIALMESMSMMFGEAFDEVEAYSGARPSATYLRRLLASDYFIALAALKDGEVVGGIAAYEFHKFEQERTSQLAALKQQVDEAQAELVQLRQQSDEAAAAREQAFERQRDELQQERDRFERECEAARHHRVG